MENLKNWNFATVLFWTVQIAAAGLVWFGVYSGELLYIFLLDESFVNTAIVSVGAVFLLYGYLRPSPPLLEWQGNMIVMFGLIGTVYGIIVAFSGVSLDNVGDLTMAKQMVTTLASGLGTALSSTILAAFIGIWLSVNSRLLGG